jgi:hypothetical protein
MHQESAFLASRYCPAAYVRRILAADKVRFLTIRPSLNIWSAKQSLFWEGVSVAGHH